MKKTRREIEAETTERRKALTKIARWKIAYYCEVMRHGKTEDEAKAIANRKA